jgi:hypothetical protein
MTLKDTLINLGKLLLGGAAFYGGFMLGAIVAARIVLQLSLMPPGADGGLATVYSLLTSPLLVLALALLAHGLGGSLATRAASLAFLTWIAYGVNTQLEAMFVTTYSSGFWFMLVMTLAASLASGIVIAWLFPPAQKGGGLVAAGKAFFAGRGAGEWLWRLAPSRSCPSSISSGSWSCRTSPITTGRT